MVTSLSQRACFICLLVLRAVETKRWILGLNESLSIAILDLQPGDELDLASGTFTGRGNCNLSIETSNITLSGSSGRTIIDCNHSSRHFDIIGSNITLKNLELVNGFVDDNGGCIHMISATAIRLTNLQFSRCIAADFGGGIYMQSIMVNPAVFENVSFSDCSADQGGALYLTSSSMIATTCSFQRNVAQDWAGAVLLTSSNATFAGDLTIFDENAVFGAGVGGAVCILEGSSFIALGDMRFFSNTAAYIGGAVFQASSNATFANDMTVFDSNSALGYGLGGAVCILDGSSFKTSGNMRVLRNTAGYVGGGIFAQGATVVFQNAEFHENSAQQGGGALSGVSGFDAASISFLGTAVFRSNWVAWDGVAMGGGGAVTSQGEAGLEAEFSFKSNSTFENNTAQFGGALWAAYYSRVVMEGHCVMTANAAVGDTAVSYEGGSGGAAYVEVSSSLSISSAEIRGNTAALRGGAIYLSDSNATIRGDVSGNTARDAGGAAVLFGASTAILRDVILELNVVSGGAESACGPADPCGGGAVILADHSALQLGPAAEASRNRAGVGDGGALLLFGNSRAVVQNASVAGNWAGGRGGGAAILDDASLLASSSLFSGNRAGGDGGGVFTEGQNISLDLAVLSSNFAGGDGGGVCMVSPLFTQLGALFQNNSAGGQGGGVFSSGCAAVIAVGPAASVGFLDNTAGADGGAVALEDNAAFRVEVAACPPSCESSMRGDGACNHEWCDLAAAPLAAGLCLRPRAEPKIYPKSSPHAGSVASAALFSLLLFPLSPLCVVACVGRFLTLRCAVAACSSSATSTRAIARISSATPAATRCAPATGAVARTTTRTGRCRSATTRASPPSATSLASCAPRPRPPSRPAPPSTPPPTGRTQPSRGSTSLTPLA